MVRIGVQTSISGGVHNSVISEKEKNGNCGQIFSHSPQSWSKPEFDEHNVEKFQNIREDFDINPWVIHTSYLVNLCSPKQDLRRKSIQSVQQDLDIAQDVGIEIVNTHLGAHTGAGADAGIQNGIESIDSLDVPEDVKLVIETDSGSGTNLGSTFNELKSLDSGVDTDLGFCVDTAHVWASGYDLSTHGGVEEMFELFDRKLGSENLDLIHLNDSKHERGSEKDEHQHLGKGKIGYDGIKSVVDFASKNSVPMIAETPITDNRGDQWNISCVKDMCQSKD